VCKTAHKVWNRTFKLSLGKQEGGMASQWGLQWQQCYVEALLETDVQNLAVRIASAEKAILSRIEDLCVSPDGQEEWQAIEDAMLGLSVLRKEVLKSSIGIKKDQRLDIIKPRMLAS
jgi:hypothetical protein